tara:strand:- start:2434 stop:3612 length:1179 start_codon:yes stop_codon:yes gene_type:complete
MSLCSGVGGIELGFKLAVPSSRAICYIENEAFACAILKARMQDKILDQAPIWTDLRTFDGKPWRGKVDCLTGGYPCQPFSVAGKKLGEKDPRHLWPEIKRLIGEIEPPICFFENVGGHLRLGFEQVANDLSELGYKVKAGLFTAQEVGAPHKRERLFILAYSGNFGCNSGSDNFQERYLQRNLNRQPKKNQQEWQGRITGTCEDCKNVADCQKIISEWNLSEGNSKQQSESKTGSSNSELANAKSNGARKHQSRIWQGIKKHCDKLANPECLRWRRGNNGMEGWQSSETKTEGSLCSCSKIMGNSNNERLEGWQCQEQFQNQLPAWPPSPTDYGSWQELPDHLKPAIYKSSDGMANRVDEIRSCGNGVVPLVAAYAWRVLSDGMDLVKDKRE